jgi:hypothetical protein
MSTCAIAEGANARRSMRAVLTLLTFCLLTPSLRADAQDLTATTEAVPIPAELGDSVRVLLQPDATVVMRGDNRLEFWWVKSLPLDTAPEGRPSWSNLADGALVGAVKLTAPMTDARGLPMKPGVYTLRFALQPQDGDHMGVSPHREFLLVAPAAEDPSAAPAGFKGAVAMAKKTLGKSHPATLSLTPTTEEPAGAILTTDEGHKAMTVSVPATHQDKPAGALAFAVTLVGQYEH